MARFSTDCNILIIFFNTLSTLLRPFRAFWMGFGCLWRFMMVGLCHFYFENGEKCGKMLLSNRPQLASTVFITEHFYWFFEINENYGLFVLWFFVYPSWRCDLEKMKSLFEIAVSHIHQIFRYYDRSWKERTISICVTYIVKQIYKICSICHVWNEFLIDFNESFYPISVGISRYKIRIDELAFTFNTNGSFRKTNWPWNRLAGHGVIHSTIFSQ